MQLNIYPALIDKYIFLRKRFLNSATPAQAITDRSHGQVLIQEVTYKMDVFGPVQSRRFDLSLGINHLPPKTCTYSCVYCQLGRTSIMTTNRAAFSEPQEIFQVINNRLKELAREGVHPDTITFVSNGEPTLDKSLGEAIRLIKPLGIQTAVITNASLLWHSDTRTQLMEADIVSVKVDSVMEDTWHKVDRPHGTLRLDEILNGIHRFAQTYRGKLFTETMLISGLNDTDAEAKAAVVFIGDLHPHTAYLALPMRPPAEEWVHPPTEERLMAVFQIFKEHIPKVELLMDLPKTELPANDKPIQSLINTLNVHPLGKNEIETYLNSQNLDWKIIESLIKKKILKSISTQGTEFFVRNYKK
ncbi:MAG: radical SAM protein [Pelolinea sp.]|nr:radical SAM protein [Pelolinea sp.]